MPARKMMRCLARAPREISRFQYTGRILYVMPSMRAGRRYFRLRQNIEARERFSQMIATDDIGAISGVAYQ